MDVIMHSELGAAILALIPAQQLDRATESHLHGDLTGSASNALSDFERLACSNPVLDFV
jgi:hypothetical protein